MFRKSVEQNVARDAPNACDLADIAIFTDGFVEQAMVWSYHAYYSTFARPTCQATAELSPLRGLTRTVGWYKLWLTMTNQEQSLKAPRLWRNAGGEAEAPTLSDLEQIADERACGCPPWVIAHAHFEKQMVVLIDEAIKSPDCEIVSHYDSLLVKGPAVPGVCGCGCGEPDPGGAYEEFGRDANAAQAEFSRRAEELLGRAE